MARLSLLLPALVIAGCGHVRGPEPQALVDQKLVGTSIGDFFAQHGPPRTRALEEGGRHGFVWESGFAAVADGPRSSSGLYCRLQLTSGPDGRIVSAKILGDMPGNTRVSTCVELLD